MTTQGRPQRADARSNRARILDAAEEVFGRGGAGASTEDVARLAGVGIATVFRHFPTKAGLLDAVLVRRFGRLCQRAEQLTGSEDPARALFDLFTELVSDAPGKIALAEALAEVSDGGGGQAERASAELAQVVGVLLERAQQAGTVRADIRLPEFYALLIGMSRAAAVGRMKPEVQARALGVVFDGLAAGGPAAGVPPAGGPATGGARTP